MMEIPFKKYEFLGNRAGPTLVVLGGVHGDEPCGPLAIERLIKKGLQLNIGKLILIPRVNALALERNVRFVDVNLNRALGMPDQDTHEGRLAWELRKVLNEADYLLDIHSYTAKGQPSVFADDHIPGTMEFARAMPLSAAIISGWETSYRRGLFQMQGAPGTGVVEYVRAQNGVAITYECGQHDDHKSVAHAYDAIQAAMRHVQLIDQEVTRHKKAAPHIQVSAVFMRHADGKLAEKWRHLQPIKAGEVFAKYADGRKQVAPEDGFVILPARKRPEGDAWGFFGVRIK